jgi:predicted ATPase
LPKAPQRPGITGATSALAKRHGLILLDNCEHLLEECADFLASLLQSGNAVRILATSREPLGLIAERVFGLPPRQQPAIHDQARC